MTEGEQEKGMRPIWYFVGWLLFIIGILVIIAGILNLFFPPPSTSVVGTTHPDLWWGAIIALFGAIYLWKHSGVRV
jgi:amino acid transporter